MYRQTFAPTEGCQRYPKAGGKKVLERTDRSSDRIATPALVSSLTHDVYAPPGEELLNVLFVDDGDILRDRQLERRERRAIVEACLKA